MSDNNLGILINMKSKMARDSLYDLSNSFVQLGKDGKRANDSIVGLGNSLSFLKRVVGTGLIMRLGNSFVRAAQSAMDIRESVHLFNVAMGDSAIEVGGLIEKLSELSGMDKIGLLDTVGEYNLLARSMGVTSDNAAVLSENISRLSLDLSSLTNRSVVKVQEDLRSGLIGQSKTMYKYGIDVTEAALKQEALNQGITKSVRHMSQAEKMQLRYIVMLKQSALSHGDFAKTLESPANQMRIFSSRMTTVARSLGTIFVPAITMVLPYLNAFAQVLDKVFRSIARLVGYEPKLHESITNTGDTFGNAADDLEDGFDGVVDSAIKTGKEANKLKRKLQQLAGFDELNILGKHENINENENENKTNKDERLTPIDFNLMGFDSNIDSIKQKSDEIFQDIMTWLQKINKYSEPAREALNRLWNEGLKEFSKFNGKLLRDFYTEFLVPVGKWTLGKDGLGRLFDITNKLLLDINWNKLNKSFRKLFKVLAPFTINIGEGLLWFYEKVLVPIASWTIGKVLPVFLDGLTAIIDGLNSIIKSAKPQLSFLLEGFLKPIGGFIANVIILNFLKLITKALEWLADILREYPIITDILTAFLIAWGLIKVLGLISKVRLFNDVMGAFLIGADVLKGALSGNLFAKFGKLSKSLGSNITAAGGFKGAFKTVFSKLFSPTGLVILGVGAGIFALTKLVKYMKKDAIGEVKLFGKGVSDSTAEAVGSYLDLEQKATVALNGLSWSNSKVTSEMSEDIIKIYGEMNTQIVTKLEEQRKSGLEILNKIGDDQLIQNKGYKESTIRVVTEMYDNKIKVSNEREAKISKILNTAVKENRELSLEEKKQIDKINKDMKEDAIEVLSENKKEQLIIMDNLKREGTKISTKASSEIIKESLRRKKSTIKEADEEYYEQMKIAEMLRKDGTVESSKAADEIEEQAIRQRKTSINEATTMHKDVVEQVRQQSVGIEKYMDLSTGNILTNWQRITKEVSSNMSSLNKDAGKSLDTMQKWGLTWGSSFDNIIIGAFRGMYNGVVSVLNGIITGMNWVLKALNVGTINPIKKMTFDKPTSSASSLHADSIRYSSGTLGHQGGPAIVNDQVGSTYREMIEFPNGKRIIPKGRNVHMPNMPVGTKVLPADMTKRFVGYKKGIGDWSKDIWDWVKKPFGLANNLIKDNVSYKNMSGLALNVAKGTVKKVTEPMGSWIKDLFKSNESNNPNNMLEHGGVGFPSPPFRKTSSFGYRIHPIFGTKKLHTGVDLAAPYGTPINAQKSGRVTSASFNKSYGNMVKIAQGSSEQLYAHMSKILTSVGASVKSGTRIGLVGSTGDSTGNHLHYEERVGGKAVDPGDILGIKSNPSVPSNVDSSVAKLGANVLRWSGTVKKALSMNGLPNDSLYTNAWLRQIKTESGGNPNAIQGVKDINWYTGNLARGLVQVIPPTFKAYKHKGYEDIMKPLDNLLAGMNYAKKRYGKAGMLNAIGKGRGYARGGFITGMTSFNVAGESGNEGIVPLEGRHMMPFADAIASRLTEQIQRMNSNNKNNNQGGIVVNVGGRTIVDMTIDEMNRRSRINGKLVIEG